MLLHALYPCYFCLDRFSFLAISQSLLWCIVWIVENDWFAITGWPWGWYLQRISWCHIWLFIHVCSSVLHNTSMLSLACRLGCKMKMRSGWVLLVVSTSTKRGQLQTLLQDKNYYKIYVRSYFLNQRKRAFDSIAAIMPIKKSKIFYV